MTQTRFTFPRSARLTSEREITSVLRSPSKRYETKTALVLAARTDHGPARLGVIVGRRYDRRSRRRNQFKRSVREAFRMARSNMTGWDILVRAKQPVTQKELQVELTKAFTQLQKAERRKNIETGEKGEPQQNSVGLKYALGALEVYRLVGSPLLGARCRFHPTCSSYAKEALQEWGLAKGLYLTLKRLAKCQPFHRGGYDPVPSALGDT